MPIATSTPGMRGGRRRRLLIHTPPVSERPSGAPEEGTPSAAPGSFGLEASDDYQPALTQLIPARLLWLTLCGLGLALQAALPVGLLHAVRAAAQAGRIRAEWLGVAERLVDVAAAACWLEAAFLAGTIYLIRRHRTDDYGGRYRIWPWIMMGFTVAAFEAPTGAARLVVQSVAGAWCEMLLLTWPALLGLAAGFLVRRDARTSISAVAAWLAALAVQLARPLAAAADWPSAPMAAETDAALRLVATALTTFGLVLYARRLRREANGWLLPRSAPADASPKAGGKNRKSAKRKPSTPSAPRRTEPSPPASSKTAPESSSETTPTLSLEEAKRKRRKKRKRRAA